MTAVRRPMPILACLLLVLAACATSRPSPQAWIRVDAATQRYAVAARDVPRGALLDQLREVAGVDVRPRPAADERLTLDAAGLTLDELVERLLPAGTRPVVAGGETDRAVGVRVPAKRGEPRVVDATARSKDRPPSVAAPIDGPRKQRIDAAAEPRHPVQGPHKADAARLLAVAESRGPRTPRDTDIARGTVRLTLAFAAGGTPSLVGAQLVEGTAASRRTTNGTYVYAMVDAEGRVLHFGSFQDPLVLHSYRPEGPHDAGRADSAFARIAVTRESLRAGRLVVVDASGMTLPAVIDAETVRAVLGRGRVVAEFDAKRIASMLDQGVAQ